MVRALSLVDSARATPGGPGERGVSTVDATWQSEDAERVTRFTVTDVEPIEVLHSDGRRFQPEGVSVRVHVSVSLDDPEPYGPTWDATVRGHWIKADGSIGKNETTERYWQGHATVPAWLDVLALRCLGNAGLTLNRS